MLGSNELGREEGLLAVADMRPRTGQDDGRRTGNVWPFVLGLMLLTLLPYLQVAGFDFVLLDDPQYILDSELVRRGLDPLALWGALTEVHADNWHPLVWWSLMLDFELFGLRPGPFHLVNLGLHVANVLLLFLVVRSWTGETWKSFFLAGVFAVHPLHVESVAWVSTRKDVLSGLFVMLSLGAYGRWVRTLQPGWWWLVTLSMGLGLLAKPIVVVLPCLLLLLDLWPFDRMRDLRLGATGGGRTARLVVEKLPWFGLAALDAVATMIAQRTSQLARDAGDWPWALRLANAPIQIWNYLAKTVWPSPLYIPYMYDPPSSRLWALGAAGLLLAVTAGLFACRRRSVAPLVGWLWFLMTLVPVIGLVQVGKQPMADRYMYLPMIGLLIGGLWSLPRPGPGMGRVFVGLGCLVLGLLAAQCRVQAGVWRNTDTLFGHTLAIDPTNDTAHYVLGTRAMGLEQPDVGLKHLHAAVHWDRARWERRRLFSGDLNPRGTRLAYAKWADVYHSLGQAEQARGMVPEAIADFRTALELNPDRLDVRMSLVGVLLARGETGAARAELSEILRRDPEHAGALRAVNRLAVPDPRQERP